jgi:hypothetical protein
MLVAAVAVRMLVVPATQAVTVVEVQEDLREHPELQDQLILVVAVEEVLLVQDKLADQVEL